MAKSRLALIIGAAALSACAPLSRVALPVVEAPEVAEAFLTPMTPEDNIDSPASWPSPDGRLWLIATAKETDQLVVYDGETGATLRRVGSKGAALGQFDRPNGVFVIDDLVYIVERDNHRVQLMRLPEFEPLAVFGGADLIKPYGLWVRRNATGYELFVTDNYERAGGRVPPLAALDRRVKRFEVRRESSQYTGELRGAFGDTGATGALRIVESIWGDPAGNQLLIAEEDESYANEIKVYSLDGAFTGRVFGRDRFAAQAEGIALFQCGDGSGFWITTQQGKARTVFHLFARGDLSYVGAFTGKAVANTDGIWLQQNSRSTRFPAGALYAVHDDQGVVAFDWRDVARTVGIPADCPR